MRGLESSTSKVLKVNKCASFPSAPWSVRPHQLKIVLSNSAFCRQALELERHPRVSVVGYEGKKLKGGKRRKDARSVEGIVLGKAIHGTSFVWT